MEIMVIVVMIICILLALIFRSIDGKQEQEEIQNLNNLEKDILVIKIFYTFMQKRKESDISFCSNSKNSEDEKEIKNAIFNIVDASYDRFILSCKDLQLRTDITQIKNTILDDKDTSFKKLDFAPSIIDYSNQTKTQLANNIVKNISACAEILQKQIDNNYKVEISDISGDLFKITKI